MTDGRTHAGQFVMLKLSICISRLDLYAYRILRSYCNLLRVDFDGRMESSSTALLGLVIRSDPFCTRSIEVTLYWLRSSVNVQKFASATTNAANIDCSDDF